MCDSDTYKQHSEMVEHIERDLQRFRQVTKQLTHHVNKVRE